MGDYNTLMYGQFSLASLLAHSNKSPRLILIQKIVEVYGSTVTISHFGERFRGGQYIRCSTCPAICKSGGTPPCPVVPDPMSGVRPLGDGVGSGYLRDGSPSVWSRGKESPGMWSGASPFPAIYKNGSTCPRALWSRRHCK